MLVVVFNKPFNVAGRVAFRIEEAASRRLLAEGATVAPASIGRRAIQLPYTPAGRSFSSGNLSVSVSGRLSAFAASDGILQQRTYRLGVEQYTSFDSPPAGFMGLVLVPVIYLFYAFVAVWLRRTELMWDAVEYGQMLFLMCFLPIQLPPSIEQFCASLEPVLLRFFRFQLDGDTLNDSPAKFYEYSTDVNFLRNVGWHLIVLAATGLLLLVAFAVGKYQTGADSGRVTLWASALSRKVWSSKEIILAEVCLLILMNTSLFAFAQYYDTSVSGNAYLGFNAAVSVVCSVCVILLPMVHLGWLYGELATKPRLAKEDKHRWLSGMNLQKHTTGLLVSSYKVIRRTAFTVLLGLFQESPSYVLAVTLLLTVTVALILHMYRPYLEEARNKFCVLQEVCLVVVLALFILLVLNDGAEASTKTVLGALTQFFGIALILVSLAYPAWEALRKLRKYSQEKQHEHSLDPDSEGSKSPMQEPINNRISLGDRSTPADQENSSLKSKRPPQ